MTVYFLGPPSFPDKNRNQEIAHRHFTSPHTQNKLSIPPRIQKIIPRLNFSLIFQTETEHSGQRLRQRAASGQEVEPGVFPGGKNHLITRSRGRWADGVFTVRPCMTQISRLTQPQRMPFQTFYGNFSAVLMIIAREEFCKCFSLPEAQTNQNSI